MRLFRVEYPRMGLAKEPESQGSLSAKQRPLGLFSKCNGNPLKVRSREQCELINMLGRSGKEASVEEERDRKRGLLWCAVSPRHPPSPFTLSTRSHSTADLQCHGISAAQQSDSVLSIHTRAFFLIFFYTIITGH